MSDKNKLNGGVDRLAEAFRDVLAEQSKQQEESIERRFKQQRIEITSDMRAVLTELESGNPDVG